MNLLVNRYEEVTFERLRPICEKNGAIVFSKVRLKDALPVEKSGVNAEDYRFCLQAHVDFLVTNRDYKILFAVEFDGPRHQDAEQAKRDQRKDSLCRRFDLSLLRIKKDYLDRIFRDWDLLSYCVEVWFMNEAFYDAQKAGMIPLEEDFDPWLVMSDGHSEKKFPFWLSVDSQNALLRLARKGKLAESIPSHWVGLDANETYRCLCWIKVRPGEFAVVATGMRSQQFPIMESDLISQIATCDLHDRVVRILAGMESATAEGDFEKKLSAYQAKFEMRASGGCGIYFPAGKPG